MRQNPEYQELEAQQKAKEVEEQLILQQRAKEEADRQLTEVEAQTVQDREAGRELNRRIRRPWPSVVVSILRGSSLNARD